MADGVADERARRRRRTDCPSETLSRYECALRELRNGSRKLRSLAEARDTRRAQLAPVLADVFTRSSTHLKEHLRACYDVDADVFVQLVDPPNRPHDPPSAFRVLAGSTWLPTEPMDWSTSPHLRRLFYSQGEGQDAETDYLTVDARRPDRRGESTFRGGLSVVLRYGLVDPAPNGRRAPDITGFVSVLTGEQLGEHLEAPIIHCLRCYAFAATAVFATYELGGALVDSRHSVKRVFGNLARMFKVPGVG